MLYKHYNQTLKDRKFFWRIFDCEQFICCSAGSMRMSGMSVSIELQDIFNLFFVIKMFQTLPNQVQNFHLVTCLIQAEIELSTAQTYCPTVYRGTVLCSGVSFFLPFCLSFFRAFAAATQKKTKRKHTPKEYLNKPSFPFSYLCALRQRARERDREIYSSLSFRPQV